MFALPARTALFPYTTLFRSVDLHALRASLIELPWVADARVSRQLPDTIVVDIVEREIGRAPRLNSSHVKISYAVFCLKKKKQRRIYKRLNMIDVYLLF